MPDLFKLINDIRKESGLTIASFGHAGDGNIHVNIMIPDPAPIEKPERGERAVKRLFEGVVALEGSISGEHGIGITKAPILDSSCRAT